MGGLMAQAKGYLGDIAVRHQQMDQALPLLQDALRLDPNVRVAHLASGGNLYAVGI